MTTMTALDQAARWLGGRGGLLGRKRDGESGNTAVWRGPDRLSAMVHGYRLEDMSKHCPALGT